MSLGDFKLEKVFVSNSRLVIPKEYFIFTMNELGEPEYKRERVSSGHIRVGFEHWKSKLLFILEDERRMLESNPGDIAEIYREDWGSFDFDEHEYDVLSGISKYVRDGSFIDLCPDKSGGEVISWRILFREQKIFIQGRYQMINGVEPGYIKYEMKYLYIPN